MSGMLYDPPDRGTPDDDRLPGDDYVMLDTITRTDVRWLWPSRIPLGKVTLLEGDPERAKSVLTLDLAARVSSGSSMPGEIQRREPAGVVIVCAEDDLADTIVPRLLAHGADLSRIASPASPLCPWSGTSTDRSGL